MVASLKKQKANQQNALKSTGPNTDAGKAIVAGNAIKHGVLSNKLILADESEGEYQNLFTGLCQSLCPAGAIELALVEKVAVNLWRQRRLVGAEQAGIELGKHTKHIADRVSEELGIGTYSSHRITVDDLEGVDVEQMEWCKAVIHEYEELPPGSIQDWTQLCELAPRIHKHLVSDADNEDLTVEDYLEIHDEGLNEYLSDLLGYCRGQIQKAVRFPVVEAVAELVRAQRAIPSGVARDKLARYQTMLDNGLYKALKALREVQQWRLATIEVVDEVDGVETPVCT